MPDNITSEPEKLEIASLDIAAQKRDELVSLFPEVRTEGGKIDFDRLKAVLGEVVDAGRERYGMSWPGKAECMRTIQAPSMGTLLPMPNESVEWATTENVIIEGDNLEVLKLLQKSYLGKVNVVLIDPPYNTGNDFIYPDDFGENLQTYLEYTGQSDIEGRKFGTSTDTDGRFHSRWLSMMYPRLFLARQLLADNGVIFVCIDDRELKNLKALLDDIFGEENFVATFSWQTKQAARGVPTTTLVIPNTEYVVCYSKHGSVRFRGAERSDEDFQNPDNDPRGLWRSESMKATGKQTNYFDIIDPATGRTFHGNWAFSKRRVEEMVGENLILFPSKADGVPRQKKFIDSYLNDTKAITTSLGWHSTENATKALMDLFDGQKVFDFPKPLDLIRTLVEQTCPRDGIVLDFFAGSGTTGHAVLAQNQTDGGSRGYILVQLPEPVEATGGTISDVCCERMKRAAIKLANETSGLLSSTRDASSDLGFRKYHLAPSNFIPWDGSASNDADQLAKQLQLGIDHTRDDRSPHDLLYEILLKSWGEPALSLQVVEESIEGVGVFSIAEGAFLI